MVSTPVVSGADSPSNSMRALNLRVTADSGLGYGWNLLGQVLDAVGFQDGFSSEQPGGLGLVRGSFTFADAFPGWDLQVCAPGACSLRVAADLDCYFVISASQAMSFRSFQATRSAPIPHASRLDSRLSCVQRADQKPSAVATNRDPPRRRVTTCCPVCS